MFLLIYVLFFIFKHQMRQSVEPIQNSLKHLEVAWRCHSLCWDCSSTLLLDFELIQRPIHHYLARSRKPFWCHSDFKKFFSKVCLKLFQTWLRGSEPESESATPLGVPVTQTLFLFQKRWLENLKSFAYLPEIQRTAQKKEIELIGINRCRLAESFGSFSTLA